MRAEFRALQATRNPNQFLENYQQLPATRDGCLTVMAAGMPSQNTVSTTADMGAEKAIALAISSSCRLDAITDVLVFLGGESKALVSAHSRWWISQRIVASPAEKNNHSDEVHWLTNLGSPSDIPHIQTTIRSILIDLSSGDFEEFNRALETIDVSASNYVHLIAVLRTTFRARNKLNSWSDLSKRTYQKLRADGMNAKQIMSGLYAD
jgi:hypothetical protein